MTSPSTGAGSFHNRDGLALTYDIAGQGPMLFCHPGGPGFSSAYLRDLGGMDKHRTLVLLNPRGTAGSDRPAGRAPYQVDDYVHDLEDLRRHLGVEAIDLMGQSHGGVVAMAYAARHPKHV